MVSETEALITSSKGKFGEDIKISVIKGDIT